MASPDKSKITSLETALDVMLKKYLEDYPQDIIDSINNKAQSIASAIKQTKEKRASLIVAKQNLDSLKSCFPTCLTHLQSALNIHSDFTKEYGTLDILPPLPISEMSSTISSYLSSLQDYAKAIDDKYFSNFTLVSNTLDALSSLYDFYTTLAHIPSYITDVFLKTEPNRRKPIIRELYRLFTALHNNTLFTSLNPNTPNPLISSPLTQQEYNSLVQVSTKALTIAKLIKHAR